VGNPGLFQHPYHAAQLDFWEPGEVEWIVIISAEPEVAPMQAQDVCFAGAGAAPAGRSTMGEESHAFKALSSSLWEEILMNQRLQNLSEPSIIEAIEANSREFLLSLGRLGGGEERDEPALQWIIGGSPISYHNCVVRATLAAGTVDEAILSSVHCFLAHHVPGSWHVGPSMSPPHLGEQLMAHGFKQGGGEPGMAVDVLTIPEQVSTPSGFVIERAQDEQDLQVWTHTLGMGFGEGEIEANWVGEMYRRAGLSAQGAWHHYLGRWHGEPVATTSLFLGAGVAGIYFVWTLPGARRQGIGAAITLAALQDARRLGYRLGILGSSSMGYSVYQRLGFREYCTLELYEWLP
jgi:GNAT superfamily N-acetyltransferase